MNELIILEGIKALFWLIIIGIGIYTFKNEIRQLLQSLSGLKIAGATFELRDNKETLRSYVLLAETLIDFLSTSDQIEELHKLMHPSQIEKLGNFALKYTNEVPESEWNEALLRNVAHLLMRFSRFQQSINICDALLTKRPNDNDLLNLKAVTLMSSRIPDNVESAVSILSDIVARFPEADGCRLNLALSLSLLERGNEAVEQMYKLIDNGYWKINKDFLCDPSFFYVREHSQEQFGKLQQHLITVMENLSLS